MTLIFNRGVSRRVLALGAAASFTVASFAPAAQAGELSSKVPQVQGFSSGSSIGPSPVQHPGAPVPKPFGLDYLVGFESDISSYQFGNYWQVVRGFDQIKNQPEVLAENLAKVVAINNAAADDPGLIARALSDAKASSGGMLEAISDSMGESLGGAFREALAEHRLPKTQYLLGNGYAARAGGLASSTFAEKYYFRYDRPFVQAPDAIKRYEDESKDIYPSSPAFPSGHTNQATWITTLMAFMLPEIGPQLMLRGAEAGYHRVVLGVHYPLDVIGGRMTGQAAAADRLNDGRMRFALQQAAQEIREEIQWRTGKTVEELVAQDRANGKEYRPTAAAVDEYTNLLDYDFTPSNPTDAPMVVPQAAPVLLAASHPDLTWEQRAEVLRQTALPAGNPLDRQGEDGSWQRLNVARAMAAQVNVNIDGSVNVQG
ncbi:acid phosphatase [Corynebacterium macginleyi]|uniref:acid phosphatase n=1 Tax=Corynebacterium macginleyi TaxID=38290 RepID=UPI000EFA0218|nr:phosphatase PAP2 family protein [Corynebacterium macginleyi]QRP21959.1 phosphatase PAP2 family protein [Corynebacterium macginleyi]RMB66873.1 phosphatase PAP2 family protein [Corynebacterium macginleyi]